MRRKPDFKQDPSRKQGKEDDSPGCLRMLFLSVGGFFVFMAVARVTAGSGTRLDQVICYGAIISFVLLVIMAIRQDDRDKTRQREAQQVWKNTCKSAEVAILSRNSSPGGSYEDEYGIPHQSRPRYHIELAMTDEQRQVYPHLTSIGFDVDEPTYSKLSEKNVARIYYQPDAPMVFLLEEEMAGF